MGIWIHLILFLISGCAIWFFAGLLVDCVDQIARQFNTKSFTVSFFLLGFLTSISEISVMVNSVFKGSPQISAGNLAGASFLILLFITPLLAILGNGIQLRGTLQWKHLAFAFVVIALPTIFMIDGVVSRSEGLASILAFGMIAYLIRAAQRREPSPAPQQTPQKLIDTVTSAKKDIVQILFGGACIFIAANVLVGETIYFSQLLTIPSSMIGLVLLSIGTTVPELVIAVRSIFKKHADIAFGDYLGSSLYNTLIFGVLVLLNGSFVVEVSEFYITGVLLVAGLILLFMFARSESKISRREGFVLISLYAAFLIIQSVQIISFAAN